MANLIDTFNYREVSREDTAFPVYSWEKVHMDSRLKVNSGYKPVFFLPYNNDFCPLWLFQKYTKIKFYINGKIGVYIRNNMTFLSPFQTKRL